MNFETSEEVDPRHRQGADYDSAGTSDHHLHHGKTLASSSSSWLRSKDPRIVRVSRAFGGKDRHSKVCTIRGLRDRRVRLSVPTAIQLYDLQERLGLDQPSKVVDWLLNAAKDEIEELPPLPIPPENFSLFNHHYHHRAMLNLNPRDQTGFKIGGKQGNWDSDIPRSRFVAVNQEDEKGEEENEQDSVIATNNFLPRLMNRHASTGSYYQLEPSASQTADLVPFPSQILVCPTTTTTAATQPSFASVPSNVEIMDPRQIMINHFQILNTDSSQINPSLYSLSQSNNEGSNIRLPLQFSMGNTRVLHSGSSTSRGNDHHQLGGNQGFPPKRGL